MIDPHDPCPPAHLPPERLAVLGLLTPFFCGVVACTFAFLPAPVACIATFFLLVVGVKALATACWEGSGEVGLRFLVVEAQSGVPIQGAKVIVLAPLHAGSSPETYTGPEGKASLIVTCRVLVERWLFGASTSAFLADWWFKVTATGYEGTGRECLDWYTVWNKGVENPDPPPIRVELKRLPAAGK